MNTGNFGQIPAHLGIACGNCNTNPIMGNRYRCMQCLNYDMCSQCFNQKIHNFHTIGVIYAPGQMPAPILQPQLQAYQQSQLQYSSPQPVFFQQAQSQPQHANQFQSNVFSFSQSPFGPTQQASSFIQVKSQAHTGVKCSNCNSSPIYGNRYKCTACFCYDLCEHCKSMNVHPMHGFDQISQVGAYPVFIPAVQSQFEPPQVFSQNVFRTDPFSMSFSQFSQAPEAKVNTGMRCDHCGVIPIIGKVFKCNVCQFYYLCEPCKSKGFHSLHTNNLVG